MKCAVLYVLVVSAIAVQGLDNGLARTPPMGWLSWERFRCNIDCKNDPDNCIGEKLFKDMADHIVADGYKDLGYEYVNIDDCWLAKERDSKGRLQADPARFPNGIKALADYIHSKGLKLGIYEDFGTKTCGGYPGSEYYLQMDAETFANWTVDFLKLDGCYSDVHQYDDAYPAMAQWLNRTGRHMLYSCSWPAYQESASIKPDYAKIAASCNIWRNYNDVQDSWDSVAGIIDFYGNDHTSFAEVAGPGNFNDPDMLIVGDFGLSYDQQRVQMGMWAIMAAPLIMSVDLRTIKPESKALLQNKNVIALNQDALGKQGKRISKQGSVEIWTKPVLPTGSFGFTFLNTGAGGTPTKISANLTSMGMTSAAGYDITDLFSGKVMGTFKPGDIFTQIVNPTGIFLGKAVLHKGKFLNMIEDVIVQNL